MKLEYPKDYEEAKIILKNSVNDDLIKRNRKINIIRSSLIAALSFGASAALGKFTVPTNFYLTLPIAATASLVGFYPLIAEHKIDKQIKSGKYFEGKTEEEIITSATRYVDEYNKYEMQKESMKKK